MNRILLAALMLASGCAATSGNKALVEVSFQSSTHLWDDGQSIDGNICFHPTHYELEKVGPDKSGVDLRTPKRHLVAAPTGPAETRVVGGIADMHNAEESVDLRFGPDHLVGRIGWYQYDLTASGDHLEGTYRERAKEAVHVKLYGADRVWSLPVAEQGVLLTNLLFCTNLSSTHDFEVDLRDIKRER
jgi:hypothetical protein